MGNKMNGGTDFGDGHGLNHSWNFFEGSAHGFVFLRPRLGFVRAAAFTTAAAGFLVVELPAYHKHGCNNRYK